jgi:DNA-binding NtrC family response regulator
LLRSLDATLSPLYLLDGQRRIVYGNAALSQWIGRAVSELAGVRCDYHASQTVSGSIEVAAGLCPPPEAFAGNLSIGIVSAVRAGGALDQRAARFVLLSSGNGSLASLLVIVDPSAATASADERSDSQGVAERLHVVLQRLRSELGRRYHIGQLIGDSEPMRRVREQVRLAAQGNANVLIVGPQGSGRHHVARTIHHTQPAAAIGPLVPIDCRLVDAEEIQAVLTSLLRQVAGAPAARPPTALLRDIDSLPAGGQHELANFLQLPGIELRLFSTARASLTRLAARGRFRRDLAYSLSTLAISLPPLCRRPEDLPLLAQFFLEEFNAQGNKQLAGFAPLALDELAEYEWPNNVAELSEVVSAACIRASGPQVLAADLPDRIHLAAGNLAHPPPQRQPIQLDELLERVEREVIERALHLARNNKSKAAQLLGVNRARLLRRLVQLGLAPTAAAEEAVVFEPLPDDP